MKLLNQYFFIITLLFYTSFSSSQTNEVIKRYSIYFQLNSYKSTSYQDIRFNGLEVINYPSYQTTGQKIGFNFDIFAMPHFNFSFDLSYTFIDNFASYEFNSYYNNEHKLKKLKFDYKGFAFGPRFYFGRINQLEIGFIYGRGKMGVKYHPFNSNYYFKISAAETAINIGYRFAPKFGLQLRTGIRYDMGRNSEIPFYGGYLSFGYGINRIKSIPKKEKKSNFLVINAMGYIGDVQENLIGLGLSLEHFLYNTNRVNIGYSIMLRGGIGFYEVLPINLDIRSTFLLGINENNKFEIDLGANIPIKGIKSAKFYQFLDIGLAYRYIDDEMSFKIGASTSGVINLSIGEVINYKEISKFFQNIKKSNN